MSEFLETAAEIADMAAHLPRPLPPPMLSKYATTLHELGFRRHPELATLRLEREGPKHQGNHAPQRLVKIDKETGVNLLRSTGDPGLADLADRIENVTTEEERAAEVERMRPQILDDLKVLGDRIGSVRPEDLE